MDLLGIDGGKVLTVDIDPSHRDRGVRHGRIDFYAGSSVDPVLATMLLEQSQHPLLVVLD